MSNTVNIDEVMKELDSFDHQLQMHVEMLAHRAIPAEQVRRWMLSQDWGPFETKNLNCKLAAGCWWYLKMCEQGLEDSYHHFYYHLVGKILHGLAIPNGGMDISIDHLEWRFRDLRRSARQVSTAP